MTLRILGPKEVRECLPMARCIEAMRRAMSLVAEGRTIQPIRQALFTPDRKGLLGLMPGYTASPEWLGAKLVSVFHGNFAQGLPSHQGVVMLFDAKHGKPSAIMDAREITAIRTAAATAVATDALARKDAKTLSFFGYGEQAREHLEALGHVRKFERVLVWGRDAKKAQAFAHEHSTKTLPVEAVATAQDAAHADVVCLLTGATDPLFFGRWLKAGQHVNAVGASTPNAAEIDTETLTRSRMFADYKDSAIALGGEFIRARDAGAISADHILGSIGDILTGKIKGRTSDADITLFKSLGMACEDLVSADVVLAEAERRNIGLRVDWG